MASLIYHTHCRICGRPLSDRQSQLRGIGPECASQERQSNAESERFPLNSRVRATTGTYAGQIGIVASYMTRRRGKKTDLPFTVMFGFSFGYFAAESLVAA